jgi:hypothetical protein
MNTSSDLNRAGAGSNPPSGISASSVVASGTPRSRTRTVIAALLLALAGVLLAGCTGGPGDREDFIEVLRLDDGFNENEATCIADAVFDAYGEDDEALGKISGAESYEWLIGEDGVEGFDQFFPGVVADCTTVGPSPADE